MYFLYFLLWIIFNGNITVEICIFGVVIAALMFAFTCRFMDYSLEKELRNLGKALKIVVYIRNLFVEIVKANIAVMKMILSDREELQPVLVEFPMDLKTDTGKVLMANAITLTPGTITVSLEGSDYMVHALDESLAPGMDSSHIADLIRDLEK